jgi:hypothetical protein
LGPKIFESSPMHPLPPPPRRFSPDASRVDHSQMNIIRKLPRVKQAIAVRTLALTLTKAADYSDWIAFLMRKWILNSSAT